MVNIPELLQKSKNLVDDLLTNWGLIALVFAACLGSFGLGRLSVLVDARPLVSIETGALQQVPAALTAGGLVLTSRGGEVYYYPWCGGAENILPQNRRYFEDEDTARAAGYRPAKNCKGLE